MVILAVTVWGKKIEKMMKKILINKAKSTLEKNIISLDNGQEFISAGSNQFRTIWVRDFCYSVRGLLALGKTELVKNQLQLIYNQLSREGYLPRGIDCVNPKLRVVTNSLLPKWLRPKLEYPKGKDEFDNRIRPEFLGEHATPAIDSNVLFVLSYLDYAKSTDDYFLKKESLGALFNVYVPLLKNGFIIQPAYSDWQDSAKRAGVFALLHIQLLAALSEFRQWTGNEGTFMKIDDLENKIVSRFYDADQQLFYQTAETRSVALDYYGFIFRYQLLKHRLSLSSLYIALKRHPIWQQTLIPGRPTYPRYSTDQISWTTKMVGLSGYHDSFHWGWLICESAMIAYLQGDKGECERILEFFAENTENSTFLGEIYKLKGERLEEYQSALYQSENPFTWTAAKCYEILAYYL